MRTQRRAAEGQLEATGRGFSHTLPSLPRLVPGHGACSDPVGKGQSREGFREECWEDHGTPRKHWAHMPQRHRAPRGAIAPGSAATRGDRVPELCSLSGSLRKGAWHRALGISSRSKQHICSVTLKPPGVLLETGSRGPSAEPDTVGLGAQGCLCEEQPR